MKPGLIVHQLVARQALRGFGNAADETRIRKPRERQPVLPAEARRAIQMIKERPELAERFLFLCEVGDRAPAKVSAACHAAQHLMPLLAGHAVEHLGVIFLDAQTRVIKAEVMSIGGSGSTVVDMPVVLRRAIVLRARMIILGHNHPSGELEPSREDLQITRTLRSASEPLGIRVVDHLIIAGTQYTSLAESGRM